MFVAGDDLGAVLAVADRGEADLLADEAQGRIVDARLRDQAALERLRHPVVHEDAGRHLQVEACVDGGDAVADAEHPVAHHEPVESPLFLEDRGEEPMVLAAPLAVQRVVGGHHACHPLVHHPLEVRQIDAAEGLGAHPHVDSEARLLDAVTGEVLGAAHHVPLQPPDEGRAHLADVLGVLAVRLLRAPPSRVAEQVEAWGKADVGPVGARLPPYGFTNALLEVVVESGRSRHGDGETGRHAAGDTPGAVDTEEPA